MSSHMWVPDPGNGDQSLGDSWPELRVENLIQGNSSLKSYSDKEHHPFLRMTGVSSLQLTSSKGKLNSASKPNPRFLLSNARVVSLILTQLADHHYLPISAERFSEFAQFMVDKSLDVLKQYCSSNITDSMTKAVTITSQCVKDLKPASHWHQQCRSELQVRKINNILQKLDSHFVRGIPNHSTSYLLSPDRDGSPATEVLASAVAQYQITGDSEKMNNVVALYSSSLQNFSTALCQLKQLLQDR